MKNLTAALAIAMMTSAAAFSAASAAEVTTTKEVTTTTDNAVVEQEQATLLTTRPENAVTIKTYYEQTVYNPSDETIGEVRDVLIDDDGEISVLILGVGGFLGLGEKNVAVPFDAVRRAEKDNSWYLVMNTTKEALEDAPGYKYDSDTGEWNPDND